MDVVLQVEYRAVAPEIAVAAAVCVVLLVDLAVRRHPSSRVIAGPLSLVATLVALVLLMANRGHTPTATLGDMFVLDDFAVVVKVLFLAVAAFTIVVSIPPLRGHRYEGEYYVLLLSSVLGTLLMASSRDLLMLFVSLELVSAPAFVLAGLRKRNARSNEAAMKFFLIGVLSAGLLVYGISLVYGFTGSTNLEAIATALTSGLQVAGVTPEPLLLTGLVFIIAGFGFKVSAVPFHFWAPDTYEGSPVPLAAFLSVASKAAGFVGLLLILLIGFPALADSWAPIVGAIAAATMVLGNVLALRQRHLIRLLAYSSVAHAGYMLIPLAIIRPHVGAPMAGTNSAAVQSLVVYLFIYAIMNMGAFGVAIAISKQYPTLLIRDLAGLGRRAPLHAMGLALFVISLGGIPPLAGWFAKFVVFLGAVNAGSTLGVVLAAIMVVFSVVSLYYYVGVVRSLYLQPAQEEGAVSTSKTVGIAVAAMVAAVLFFGVFPEPLASLGEAAKIALCC